MAEGRKRRAVGVERVNFIMRLECEMHQQLKLVAESKQQSLALVIENCLRHLLAGEAAVLDRAEQSADETPDLEDEIYPKIYAEVEVLLANRWHQLTARRQQALTYLALFPYEPVYRVARMISMTRQGLQKIKESTEGLKVVNHFSERSLWSNRPELLRSVIEKAISSEDPVWSELAMRIFGEYGLRVAKQETRLHIDINNNVHKPADLDRELIEQAKLLNMTPARFTLLWELEKGKAELTALPS